MAVDCLYDSVALDQHELVSLASFLFLGSRDRVTASDDHETSKEKRDDEDGTYRKETALEESRTEINSVSKTRQPVSISVLVEERPMAC